MQDFITQTKKIPIKGNYDVIVAGGGIAGISAALASKRTGARTLLLERSFLLGGLATAGLVTIYLPLCDGLGNQVSYGIVEELIKLSVKHGAEAEDISAWVDENASLEERKKTRYRVRFNPSMFAILCEQLLRKEGVEILYGSPVCDVVMNKNAVSAVIVENKSGREAFTANAFVDATGDADLFFRAGAKTKLLGQGNVTACWYYENFENEYHLRMLGFADVPDKYKTEKAIKEDDRRRFTGVDGKGLSEFCFCAHDEIVKDFLKKGNIKEGHDLCSIASIPQVRMTRRLDGAYTMNDEEERRYFEDSIGIISDWRKNGPVYEIPFRTLYGEIDNLFSCGRMISVTDDMWDITRVIPACAVTGQASGTASAMLDCPIKTFDVKKLQERLREDGVVIHVKDLGI